MPRSLSVEGARSSPKSGEVPAGTGGFPPLGTMLGGKYLIEEIIGEGGVGIVVAALNVELGERVAIKLLRAEMLDQPDVVGRFLVEAKAACSIKSSHSASVFDAGRTSEGVPFLVMELLEGEDLATLLETRPRLDARTVAEYAIQVCDALAVAHAKGIVHRDIKPENLFLETRSGMPSIKVLDFGISKTALTGSVLSTVLPLVRTETLMGTPLYMSPEQVRAPDEVDSRSDIWSLGVVMFELLTGDVPVHAESITELCAAILDGPLDSLREHRPDLSVDFVAVIERCLEKDLAKRYPNVAELALALMPFAPKRARLCAERAAHVLVSAGLASEESVRFPSAMPPSFSSGPVPLPPASSSHILSGVSAPGVFAPPEVFVPPPAVTEAPSTVRESATLVRSSVRVRRKSPLTTGVLVALLLLAGVLAVAFLARSPGSVANAIALPPASPSR